MKKKFCLCVASIFIFSFLVTGSAFAITQQRIVIPYASENNTWWTGIAVHNPTDETMYCYLSVYAEDGSLIGGDCFTVDPKAIKADNIINFINETIEGRISIYIQTNDSDGWTVPFSVTMFMGNDQSGFGMQTFQSQDYETIGIILCRIIMPPSRF